MSPYVKQLDTLLESCIQLPGVLATFLFALIKLLDKQFKFGFTAGGAEAHCGEEGGGQECELLVYIVSAGKQGGH